MIENRHISNYVFAEILREVHIPMGGQPSKVTGNDVRHVETTPHHRGVLHNCFFCPIICTTGRENSYYRGIQYSHSETDDRLYTHDYSKACKILVRDVHILCFRRTSISTASARNHDTVVHSQREPLPNNSTECVATTLPRVANYCGLVAKIESL